MISRHYHFMVPNSRPREIKIIVEFSEEMADCFIFIGERAEEPVSRGWISSNLSIAGLPFVARTKNARIGNFRSARGCRRGVFEINRPFRAALRHEHPVARHNVLPKFTHSSP